jgi:hypothetical protein
MKSVHLDRKISTTARLPKRSIVVESPSGKTAHPDHPPIPQLPRSHAETQLRQISEPSTSKLPIDPRQDSRNPAFQNDPRTIPKQSSSLPLGSQSQSNITPKDTPQQLRSHPSDPTLSPRPNYNRTTTAVRVVDDQAEREPRDDRMVLGSAKSPVEDEAGITLADLTEMMQAEQAKEHRRSRPQGSFMLLADLPPLEYFIIKHITALALSLEPCIRDEISLDDLLEIIDAKKNTFWGKLFKGSNEKKPVKKKGRFYDCTLKL